MTSQQKTIWHNGALIPFQDAKVHVLSHGLHYGSSVFEGIRAYATPKGPCVFRLHEHMERLFDSARIYRMLPPYDCKTLTEACCEVVSANGYESAYIRPLIYRGFGKLGLVPSPDTPIEVAIAALEWGTYLGEGALERGVDVCVSSWTRLRANTMPTMAKAGGNYMSSQLIATEAKRNGFHEAIALDANGYVSEGPGENVFVVRKGVLYTPPITASILPGITRDTIITLARSLGYEVREENMVREALYLADELFFTGTAAEITPVRSVDGITVGAGKRGPVTEQLQKTFFGLFSGETPDQWHWLTPVHTP
jgi:branched-chain amino acid aminotransferase